MIFETGTQHPTATQRRVVRDLADDSFTTVLPRDFGPVPCGIGWMPDLTTGVALRMRCVEPHQDDWVGKGHPRRHAAVFWLVDAPKIEEVILHVGSVAKRMSPGDFVIFKDNVMHSVFAKRMWRGCAYQVRPYRSRQ